MSKTKKSAYKKAVRKLKWCWLATEVKGGWRLKFVCGPLTFTPVPNKIMKKVETVENFCNSFDIKNGNIVFIHLKNTKYPERIPKIV